MTQFKVKGSNARLRISFQFSETARRTALRKKIVPRVNNLGSHCTDAERTAHRNKQAADAGDESDVFFMIKRPLEF